MPKKRKNDKIQLSTGVEKIIKSFCRATNRDIQEFLEEAIVEKIEFEDAKKDAIAFEREAAAEEGGEIFAEEPPEDFKRKH